MKRLTIDVRTMARRASLAAAALMTFTASVAHAQYPQRPVRIVVAYAAGNVTDVLARLVAERLSARWGQQVIVENRPGQGGSLGLQAVAKSAPDGYVVGFIAMAAVAINPHLYPSVGYDPLKDLTPITAVAYPHGLLVANPGLGVRTYDALVALSRTRPAGVFFGTSGSGTIPHLNFELLKQATPLRAEHVPYKGATGVLADVMGGRLDVAQEAQALTLPQIRAGKLTPIATLSGKRLPSLPDVPAIGEVVAGFVPVVPWLSLIGPAGLPPDVVDKMQADVAETVRAGDLSARLEAMGLEPVLSTPAEFAHQIRLDHERLGRLVKALQLKVD